MSAVPTLPDVTVFDQDGNSIRFCSELLKSDVAVITFIYTSCQGTCRLVGQNLARTEAILKGTTPKPAVRTILISSDPETDSPPVLKAWAKRFGSPSGWTLITGGVEEVDRLSIALTGSPVAGPRHHVPRVIIGSQF